MLFRHFRVVCAVRVALLAATLVLMAYLVFESPYPAAAVAAGVLAVYQVVGLVRFVERTNRDLVRFLQAIRYEDFSQTFSTRGMGKSFGELKAAFTDVLEAFKRTRAEREEHARYLQTVVQHVGVGVLTFHPDGEIDIVNSAARRLLQIGPLRNVRQLESLSKPLVESLLKLHSGDRAMVKVDDGGRLLQISMSATELRMRGSTYTLVTLQDIQSELEEQEMEAWQKLIRVLTHEIMNSVTPISSLASTIRGLLAPTDGPPSADTLADVHAGAETIERRSQGLIHFVETYRELTRIPKPDFQIFLITELFSRIEQLVRTQVAEKGIAFTAHVDPESLELTADPELVEQVLLNLVKNAIEAVEGIQQPEVTISGGTDGRGRCVVRVRDNGPGIDEDVQERIFIPFFTTKREGSGIGLSICRQIMRSHGGSISVKSTPGEGAEFGLRF